MAEKDRSKGYANVEMIMVMTLLILFGITIYTMIFSGKNTQERIMDERNAQTDARVALSYINVRLRQNDAEGKVSVEKINLTGENAIIIRERTDEYEYDTWIYGYKGKLYECLVDPGTQPTESTSFFIVDSEKVEITVNPDGGSITNTVYYYYGTSLKNISSTIYMRSSGSSPDKGGG